MPVLRFPHIPPRFASRGWLTVAEWGSLPINAPETPTIASAARPLPPAASRCLPLAPALGTKLAATPHETPPLCYKQAKTAIG
jgi:hypothetical protein